jgi:putative ABC transport system permease protein
MSSVRRIARIRLRRHRGSTALIMLLIAMIAGTTLIALDGAARTGTALDRLAAHTRPGNGFVMTDGLTGDQIARIQSSEDVDSSALLATLAVGPALSPDAYLPFVSATDDRFGREIERSRIVRGRAARPENPFDVVLGEQRAKLLHVDVGSDLPMYSFSAAQVQKARATSRDLGKPAGPKFTLHVVGIERGPRQINSDSQINELTALTPAFWQHFRRQVGSYGSFLVLRVEPAHIARFTKRVKAMPGMADAELVFGSPQRVQDALDVAGRALLLFAFLAGAAGLVVLALVFVRRMSLDADEDATLAALGLTRGERRRIAALEGFVAVGVGSIGAVVVAVVGSRFMPFGLARRVDPAAGFSFDGALLGLGFLAVVAGGCAIVVAAAWHEIGRDRVAETRRSFASRLAQVTSAPLTIAAGLRLGFDRGEGTRAIPVGTTVLAATLAVAGSCCALLYGASLQRMIDQPTARGWTWDVTVGGGDMSRILPDADARDVVEARIATIAIDDRPVEGRSLKVVRGTAPDTIVAGRAPIADDEVALGAETMRAAHVHIGDKVRVVGPSSAADLHIVGQAVFAGVSDDPHLADGALMTAPGLSRVYADLPDDSPGASADQSFKSFLVTFRDGVDRSVAARNLEVRVRHNDPGADVARATTPDELRRLRDVRALPIALAVFVGLLAVIGMAYTLRTTVTRRRTDIAVYKTMGMTRRSVFSLLLVQATTTAIIGILLGIPIGLLAARAVWKVEAAKLGTATVVVAPIAALVLLYAFALFLANLVAMMPAVSAARTRPALIMRSE